MSKIPELLRMLADEYEQEEIYRFQYNQTITSQINDVIQKTTDDHEKIKEVANAFATFANILGKDD